MRIIGEGLTFDDVLIVPARSSVGSRKSVDTSVTIAKGIVLNVPILSAAMDTVTESRMAAAMAREGGIGVVHRFMSVGSQCGEVLAVKRAAPLIAEEIIETEKESELVLKEKIMMAFNGSKPALDSSGQLVCSAAIGVKDTTERSDALLKAGCDVLCIDVAHGHHANVISAIRKVKKEFDAPLIAGNIATSEAAEDLITAGADCVKVGIGPGSTCTTRLVTGCGVPQLTAIQWCREACDKYGAALIADGGMRGSGDLVKAIAAGADAGMFGGLFAGCDEAPSLLVIEENRKYKLCRGMASSGAMRKRLEMESNSIDYKNIGNDTAPEGTEIIVPYNGSVSGVLKNLAGGLRSGMSYCGASTLEELKKNARFVRVSGATHNESKPHNEFFV